MVTHILATGRLNRMVQSPQAEALVLYVVVLSTNMQGTAKADDKTLLPEIRQAEDNLVESRGLDGDHTQSRGHDGDPVHYKVNSAKGLAEGSPSISELGIRESFCNRREGGWQ